MAAAVALVLALVPAAGRAETAVLEGHMAARVAVELRQTYQPISGTAWIETQYPDTQSARARTWRQDVVQAETLYSLPPTRAATTRDRFGNLVRTATWEQPSAAVEVRHRITVDMQVALSALESEAAYPLASVGPEARLFLTGTPLVQQDDPHIETLARRLTAGVRSQREAVSRLLNHVVDHLRYRVDPPQHDARFALDRGIANCQGYAHLSLALLRAAGIPARMVAGISLDKGWVVPLQSGTLTVKQGQGRHAWVEIYYPDLGWLPYDPQTTHRFVSIYHIRQKIGLDVGDVVEVVSASPALPVTREVLSTGFDRETVNFRTLEVLGNPRNYVVAGRLADRLRVATAPPTPSAPPPIAAPPPPPSATSPAPPPAPAPPAVTAPPTPAPAKPEPSPPAPSPPPRSQFIRLVEFGNVDFPAALRILDPETGTPGGRVVRATRSFIVETADYVTGPEQFAQAFTLEQPLLLGQVSLALQKFGGTSGELWLELRRDQGGQPGTALTESRRLAVGSLVSHGGYRWVLFSFRPDEGGLILPPGRYWVVLHHTGDGVFNWYFSLGNAYGNPDDSRSRARGRRDWSNVLSYRFNFRVTGLARP